ncbi:TetR/AcrR family transcriptional regulator [Williamsia deligens]|uniref:TetR/AcrR family transcriptional regulator n=1 Tax=Williamsia deligens TaxID=321325 RepID=A0ABW3GHD3_9NOCA|nr:TetR/AcrR family transcriptional regulator [Williamsia deligens]MCP2195637.1 transcriptional regulator, TetR family [Williamsia deligens]
MSSDAAGVGPQPSPRETARTDDVRGRLIDALATSIVDRGYRDSTVADVVRIARMSRRTFYEHFSDKEQCFAAMLETINRGQIDLIYRRVDRSAPWRAQVRAGIESWIEGASAEPALTLSWIRDAPTLRAGARTVERATREGFVDLVSELADSEDLRREGHTPPSRPMVVLLVGGLREVIASQVEAGHDPAEITEIAVAATVALLVAQSAVDA